MVRLTNPPRPPGSRGALLLTAVLALGTLFAARTQAQGRDGRPPVRLRGHVPAAGFTTGQAAPADPQERIELAVALAPRDGAGLAEFLRRVYDPADPLYGQFLTPEEFRD